MLKSALGAAVGVALPFASGRAATAPTVARVTSKIALLSGAGGNVLALTTDDGLVVVDSGTADSASELVTALGALPGGDRVRTLFNTHWHLDQVGGNETLGAAGAHIVAHEKTRLRLQTGYYLPDDDRFQPPAPAAAQPAESVYTRGETKVGAERIEYGYLLEAHTDGDIYVFLRDSNVIAVGDAVSPERDPELDWFGGGWLGGRVDALTLLLTVGNAQTKFVPSYGAPVDRAAVQRERDMLQRVFDKLVELVRKGDSAEDIVAAGAMDGTGRTWRDPLKFVHDAYKGLWANHNKLSPDVV